MFLGKRPLFLNKGLFYLQLLQNYFGAPLRVGLYAVHGTQLPSLAQYPRHVGKMVRMGVTWCAPEVYVFRYFFNPQLSLFPYHADHEMLIM
ncbi:MAG: hypothetical protein CFE23_15480 [Flavobacterium sp. BFFFF1]|nr:MAG: hypothetical protein CFE23_15480 [Flavobacterium sp. BFFFF1]